MKNKFKPPKISLNRKQRRSINIALFGIAQITFLIYLMVALYRLEFKNAFISLVIWFVLLFLLPDTSEK